MANQALTPKTVHGPLNGSKVDFIPRLALALGILVFVVITAISMGNSVSNEVKSTAANTNRSALPQDGRAYFTEPYWEMGSVEKDEQPVTATEPEWSFYTEQYWNRTR